MMLNFLRQLAGYPPAERKQAVIQRRIRVPDEHVLELLALIDAMRAGGKVDRYNAWRRIREVCPEVKENERWFIDTSHATALYMLREDDE